MTLGVALVMVGDELLSGARTDTNGSWMARRIHAAGARVTSLRTVPDDARRIADAVDRAAREARLVVVSGGLGPTLDDQTREGLALSLGQDLVEDADALASIALVLSTRGLDLDSGRRRQARVPRGGCWLENAEGTAPGLEIERDDALVLALPGVPRELKAMYDALVHPRIEALGGLQETCTAVVPCAGVPEAEVGHRLQSLTDGGDVAVGFYPHEGEVSVRLEARGEDSPRRVAAVEAEVRRRLGADAWAQGRIQVEVVRLLRERDLGVTTAESITGGLVARMLTEVPGASDVFRGGWVTYSDAWKARVLGVPADLLATHGAVSAEVARAMAEGARAKAGVSAAMATTGIAGPGPGRSPDGTPIDQGTYYAAAALAGRTTRVRSRVLPIERPAVQRRAAVDALDLLRRVLTE